MSQYTITPHGTGVIVDREGLYLGVFADKQTAEAYVVAHQNFKKSISGRFANPAAVLSKDSEQQRESFNP